MFNFIYAANTVIRNINVLGNLNPLLPFSFTYDYRVPTEWQLELIIGTSLNPAGFSSIYSQNATNTFITSGEVGLKFGLPGDFTLFATWPWLGGIFSVTEGVWLPEIDISVLAPVTLGALSGVGFSESFSFNAVLKKSLPPFRICGGFNFLASPQFSEPESEEDVSEVGQSYIGVGVEWMVNPFIRLLAEFRYQFSSLLYSAIEGESIKFEAFPPYANQILGVGFEYLIDLPKFAMKFSIGYAINLGAYMEGIGVSYGTQGVSIGMSFLFPFPW